MDLLKRFSMKETITKSLLKYKIKIIYLILLSLSYVSAKEFFYEEDSDVYLLIKILFWTGVLYVGGFIPSIICDVRMSVTKLNENKNRINYKLITLTLWILAVSTIGSIGWISENVSGSIIVFISFVPSLWLFNFRSSTIAKVGVLFIILAAITSYGQDAISSVLAELSYLWIVSSFLKRIKETYEYIP